MENKDFFYVSGTILSVMIALGLIGNVISFITWRAGKRCKNLPGATYLTALSLSDTLALGTAGIKYAIQLLFGLNLWDLNTVSCTLFHTTWHLFFLVSTWIVVFLTIERTVAVTQPLKSTLRTSKRTELIAVGLLSGVSLLINLPFTFGAKMIPAGTPVDTHTRNDTNTTDYILGGSGFGNESDENDQTSATVAGGMVCGADSESFYYKYENEFHNWFIDFGLLFSVPVSILTVCNIVILVTLCRRSLNPALKETKAKDNVSGALTARVVILSVVQCVSVGPFSIAALIPGVLPEVKAVDTVFIDQLLTILVLIWYLNNCVNFILYSLFGKAFRRDCADLFSGIFRALQVNKSTITFSNVAKDKLTTSTTALVESSSSHSNRG